MTRTKQNVSEVSVKDVEGVDFIKKQDGLMILENRLSNLNGDPDMGSSPRYFNNVDGFPIGWGSPVSLKRKFRDLIDDKKGPLWAEASKKFGLHPDNFNIIERPDRNKEEIFDELSSKGKEYFLDKYVDVRWFGTTFLDESKSRKGDKDRSCTASGPIGILPIVSIAPVEIVTASMTKKTPNKEEMSRGYAPDGIKFVQYGVYVVRFVINPTAAKVVRLTQKDIDVFKFLLPHVYSHTASSLRSGICVRNIFWMTHKDSLGSVPYYKLFDALTPVYKGDKNTPAENWSDFTVTTKLPQELMSKLSNFEDIAL